MSCGCRDRRGLPRDVVDSRELTPSVLRLLRAGGAGDSFRRTLICFVVVLLLLFFTLLPFLLLGLALSSLSCCTLLLFLAFRLFLFLGMLDATESVTDAVS